MNLTLNQRGKNSQLQRLIRPKTQYYKTREGERERESTTSMSVCVYECDAAGGKKIGISLTRQDAPAAQAGPLVPGMREPTTRGGSLQSFRHVMLSPVPGQGKQRCPSCFCEICLRLALIEESIKCCCFAATGERCSWNPLENTSPASS